MKIGPWHRICRVSKNILFATDLLGPKYFAEEKVLQHYTGNFPTCQRIVPLMRKRLNLLCGNSWSILASASPTPWFWPKFWRRMHAANKTVRRAMYRAVRQRQDQALQQQFILRDNNNQTYYIQCKNQLELDNNYETAQNFNSSTLMLKLLLLCCRHYGCHHCCCPNLCHHYHCHTPPLPGMHLTMRLVVES